MNQYFLILILYYLFTSTSIYAISGHTNCYLLNQKYDTEQLDQVYIKKQGMDNECPFSIELQKLSPIGEIYEKDEAQFLFTVTWHKERTENAIGLQEITRVQIKDSNEPAFDIPWAQLFSCSAETSCDLWNNAAHLETTPKEGKSFNDVNEAKFTQSLTFFNPGPRILVASLILLNGTADSDDTYRFTHSMEFIVNAKEKENSSGLSIILIILIVVIVVCVLVGIIFYKVIAKPKSLDASVLEGTQFSGTRYAPSHINGSHMNGTQHAGSRMGMSSAMAGSRMGGSSAMAGSRMGGSRMGGSHMGGSLMGGSRMGGSRIGGSRSGGSRNGGHSSDWPVEQDYTFQPHDMYKPDYPQHMGYGNGHAPGIDTGSLAFHEQSSRSNNSAPHVPSPQGETYRTYAYGSPQQTDVTINMPSREDLMRNQNRHNGHDDASYMYPPHDDGYHQRSYESEESLGTSVAGTTEVNASHGMKHPQGTYAPGGQYPYAYNEYEVRDSDTESVGTSVVGPNKPLAPHLQHALNNPPQRNIHQRPMYAYIHNGTDDPQNAPPAYYASEKPLQQSKGPEQHPLRMTTSTDNSDDWAGPYDQQSRDGATSTFRPETDRTFYATNDYPKNIPKEEIPRENSDPGQDYHF